MKGNYLVLFASSYDYINKDDRHVQGLYIDYINADNLDSKSNPEAVKRGDLDHGHRTANARLPYEQKANITTVPGIYELTMELSTDRNRNATIVPVEARFLHEVKLTPANQK